jgi:hypothetical protein
MEPFVDVYALKEWDDTTGRDEGEVVSSLPEKEELE